MVQVDMEHSMEHGMVRVDMEHLYFSRNNAICHLAQGGWHNYIEQTFNAQEKPWKLYC